MLLGLKTMQNKPVLIFTGGHHTSSLAVANQLKHEGYEILWLGHRHSMWHDQSDSAEYREVVAAGIPFYELKAGKFYHVAHMQQLLQIPLGFIQAFALIFQFKIKYSSSLKGIFSSGGYLAVPVVFAGWLLGIPAVTHEQTVVAGWANKFISVFAKKIALAWPDSAPNFPSGKTQVTGLPLRPEIASVSRQQSSRSPLVFVMGGKQGSHVINQAIFSCLSLLPKSYQVIHQVGSNSVYQDFTAAAKLKSSHYSPVEYLSPHEVSQIFHKCSVVVCRSGAHTTYELAFLGIPSVLIPLPEASHDEQLKNAQYLATRGNAVILPQSQLSAGSLIEAINSALALQAKPLPVPANSLQQVVQLIKQQLI